MKIKKKVKRELNKTLLSIEVPETYKEDYRIRMLQENHLQGLLEIKAYAAEAKSVYEYEISGKVSLEQRHDKKKITSKEMKRFLECLHDILELIERHLLNPNSLLLDPGHIYWEKGEYFFCYIPGWEDDIKGAFHALMDNFVQWTDYQDVPSVKMAFLLHKETMEQNYSLKKIIEKIKEQEEQREKLKERKQKEEPEITVSAYETTEHDWITEQEMGAKILRETDNMWRPVKKFLQKHAKPKWGDWDGIYIEEEEF